MTLVGVHLFLYYTLVYEKVPMFLYFSLLLFKKLVLYVGHVTVENEKWTVSERMGRIYWCTVFFSKL